MPGLSAPKQAEGLAIRQHHVHLDGHDHVHRRNVAPGVADPQINGKSHFGVVALISPRLAA